MSPWVLYTLEASAIVASLVAIAALLSWEEETGRLVPGWIRRRR